MGAPLRFLWNVTRGHRWRPWRSPLVKWRMETYAGIPAEQIGFATFVAFAWRERAALWRFLRWTGAMSAHRRHSRHPLQSGQAGPGESN